VGCIKFLPKDVFDVKLLAAWIADNKRNLRPPSCRENTTAANFGDMCSHVFRVHWGKAFNTLFSREIIKEDKFEKKLKNMLEPSIVHVLSTHQMTSRIHTIHDQRDKARIITPSPIHSPYFHIFKKISIQNIL
jgi:hypothetical protein